MDPGGIGSIRYEDFLSWIWHSDIQSDREASGVPESLSCTPTAKELLDIDTFVFDCDGVIWGIPEADTITSVAVINRLLAMGKRLMFVTNNSNKRRADFVAQLISKGIDFGSRSEDEKLQMVLSASYTTAHYLKRHSLRQPFVITSHTGILEELRLLGITDYYATVTDDGEPREEFKDPCLDGVADIITAHPDVDCIVVGWDMGITARKVATAINYIKWHEELNSGEPGYRQLPIIAASGDAGGVLGTAAFKGRTVRLNAIGNGAMADIIARSFDPPLKWLDMGKSADADALIEMLQDPQAYSVNLGKSLMIGDTLQTDIMFGNKSGMKTLLVLTGVTREEELQNAGDVDPLRRPTYVLPKVGALLQILPE